MKKHKNTNVKKKGLLYLLVLVWDKTGKKKSNDKFQVIFK